jgi:hypothetical protein
MSIPSHIIKHKGRKVKTHKKKSPPKLEEQVLSHSESGSSINSNLENLKQIIETTQKKGFLIKMNIDPKNLEL